MRRLLKTQGPSFSAVTLSPMPFSEQNSEKMLSDGRYSETTQGWGHFRGCPISLFSWYFCFSFHICMAQPLRPDRGMCLLTVSASSKCWFTDSHHGFSPPPHITRSIHKRLNTFPTCRDGSLSALTASASAFLCPSSLQRDLSPAHLCASGHGIGH